MQSFNKNPLFSFRADANALGGYLDEPFARNLPAVAPVSLPAVGGLATARSEAGNLDEIIAFSSAYSRVSGMERADGSVAILVTAVVEDLNILEVVTAKRLVSQLSLEIAADAIEPAIRFAGSGFEGLRVSGQARQPTLNPVLLPEYPDMALPGRPVSWQDVAEVGRSQATRLLDRFKGTDAEQWVQQRYAGVASIPLPGLGGVLLGSLVDGFEGDDPDHPSGHILEIHGIGRIFLGEFRVSCDAVQLVGIRAELGCPVGGRFSAAAVGGGGTGENSRLAPTAVGGSGTGENIRKASKAVGGGGTGEN